ncbi:MAG: hypothetical protein ACK5JI_05450 [Azonexus sp.]
MLLSQPSDSRWRFARRYAFYHLLLSAFLTFLVAFFVFRLLYPAPFHRLFGVGEIFFLLLVIDVVCGPFLTFILSNPKKSRHERWLDFSIIGIIQVIALVYGIYSVWAGRPVVLAFETDRLVVVGANEIQIENLGQAPENLRHLPWWGWHQVGTRKASDNNEFFTSMELGFAGVSPAMRPDWWTSWSSAQAAMRARARPVTELIERHPQDVAILQATIQNTGLEATQLHYLPLTTRKVKEWIVLLDGSMRIVGYAPINGF